MTAPVVPLLAVARKATFYISGAGRIGTQVTYILERAGVQCIAVGDGQEVDNEAVEALTHLSKAEIGRPKAQALARFFAGRSKVMIEPVMARTEAAEVDPYIQAADVVISCANTVAGRLAAEQKAERYKKTCIQIAALNSRYRLGGVITIRMPQNAEWAACLGCLLDNQAEFPRDEILAPSVTASLGAIGANMALQSLTTKGQRLFGEHNFVSVDLDNYRMEALAISRRPGCQVCGQRSA